jgi:hypothetical protein
MELDLPVRDVHIKNLPVPRCHTASVAGLHYHLKALYGLLSAMITKQECRITFVCICRPEFSLLEVPELANPL